MIKIVIEDKKCEPKKAYTFEGKVFVYKIVDCIVVCCNEKVTKIYLENDEGWTLYNY